MDLFLLGNSLLFFGAFAVQLGFLSGEDSTTDTETETETESTPDPLPGITPLVDLYDATAYTEEVIGTSDDDVYDDGGGFAGKAWFLDGGNDTLTASLANDYVKAGAGDDDLTMKTGNDIAYAGAGDDTVEAGLGDDTVFGGDGNDVISGSKGDDLIEGGAGDDTLSGSRDNDTLDGGSGDDVLYSNLAKDPGASDDGVDSLSGGDGDDALHLGSGDTGEGGDGADGFFLYETEDPGDMAQITDFDPGDDVITVNYEEQTDPDTGDPVDPTLEVVANDTGTAATITLNGVDIGFVVGGQDLTPDDIALIPIS